MDEAEWAASRDPRELLDYHRMKRDPRRLRLLAVACARLIPPAATPPQFGPVLDVLDRYADGAATRAEFLAARKLVRAAVQRGPAAAPDETLAALGILVRLAGDALEAQTTAIAVTRYQTGPDGATAECGLIRCVFGNPYRAVVFDPAWRTEAVVALAAGVATASAFERLPILADALADAGCAHPDVLAHCRGGGPHATGCWVVDGLRGRSAQSGT